jgi:hypothetical protein
MRISISLSSRSDREGAGGEEEQAKREWVNDPIKCGFLKCFAEMEFSSENINYLIAVDAFRDNLLKYIFFTKRKSYFIMSRINVKLFLLSRF